MIRVSGLKSEDPEFKSRSDHQLDLFQELPDSTPRLRLDIANWSALCQSGTLAFSSNLYWGISIAYRAIQTHVTLCH